MKPLSMVELWPFAVRVHQTRLSARCAADPGERSRPPCGRSGRVISLGHHVAVTDDVLAAPDPTRPDAFFYDGREIYLVEVLPLRMPTVLLESRNSSFAGTLVFASCRGWSGGGYGRGIHAPRWSYAADEVECWPGSTR